MNLPAQRVLEGLRRLSDLLLEQAIEPVAGGSSLLIVPAALTPARAVATDRRSSPFGVSLLLGRGATRHGNPEGLCLECSTQQLPFQDHVFRAVTLFHVLERGSEAELDEACRVLALSGRLRIVGWQRRWPWARPAQSISAIRCLSVFRRLGQLEMEVDRMSAAGLLGTRRPESALGQWSKPLLPFADVVLIEARHRRRAISPRLALKDIPAGAAPTALVMNRAACDLRTRA